MFICILFIVFNDIYNIEKNYEKYKLLYYTRMQK